MNPNADKLWPGPRWTLAVLLALLGMLGPFSIDTYIPAFSSIARALGATPVEMQQTLSAYLFGVRYLKALASWCFSGPCRACLPGPVLWCHAL
jgi:MFS transporter, DHA1 family, multidrug resistance protein